MTIHEPPQPDAPTADLPNPAPEGFEVPEHRIDREIYAMPAFTTLAVRDIDTSRGWYETLGFVVLAEMGTGPGRLVHLRRYRYQDLLLVSADPDDPVARASRVRTSFSHTGPLDDLDRISCALAEFGHGQVEGPTTTPWYAVELVAVDDDGHEVVLTARSPEPPPAEFLAELEAEVGGGTRASG